jgi:hypothetical protein
MHATTGPNGHGRACSSAKGKLFMTTNLKRGVWVLAMAVGIGVSAGTVQAVASPWFQDHEPQQQHEQQHEQDYSHNKNYQQGMREGKTDHMHNMDHSKKRHFKKDEDSKAYEAGYQKGRHD